MGDESMRKIDHKQLLGDEKQELDTNCNEGSNFKEGDFIRHFVKTNGPPQIITLCLLIALALGSTIGVVPAVVEDRYARLSHGYIGEARCLDIEKHERPRECLLGNEDAQNSAAIASFISNTLTFATSSLMGSISDERGRRGEAHHYFYPEFIIFNLIKFAILWSIRNHVAWDWSIIACPAQLGAFAIIRKHESFSLLCMSCIIWTC